MGIRYSDGNAHGLVAGSGGDGRVIWIFEGVRERRR